MQLTAVGAAGGWGATSISVTIQVGVAAVGLVVMADHSWKKPPGTVKPTATHKVVETHETPETVSMPAKVTVSATMAEWWRSSFQSASSP